MIRKITAILFFFSLIIDLASARETKSLCLHEKALRSDAIFIGSVLSVQDTHEKTAGIYKYAVVRVDKVLKGPQKKGEIKFVTRGISSELNPLCCKLGEKYIFFARRGIDVFDDSNDRLRVIRTNTEEYFSATNGHYSVYLINDGMVSGWPLEEKRQTSVEIRIVLSEIKEAIRYPRKCVIAAKLGSEKYT
ncbi:MAG: hypothetical protein E6Q50_01585 [Lysobacter sp.]|nr:MAG: hypothetical protein E6Q50_01585 [Lysobacter sp.]